MLAAALGRPPSDFMIYPYMSGFLRAWANLPGDNNGVHQLIMKTGDQLQPAYLSWQANINNGAGANLPEAAAADLAELASKIESALEPIKMVLPTMDELIARELQRLAAAALQPMQLCQSVAVALYSSSSGLGTKTKTKFVYIKSAGSHACWQHAASPHPGLVPTIRAVTPVPCLLPPPL
jgi:hypothetical protein